MSPLNIGTGQAPEN